MSSFNIEKCTSTSDAATSHSSTSKARERNLMCVWKMKTIKRWERKLFWVGMGRGQGGGTYYFFKNFKIYFFYHFYVILTVFWKFSNFVSNFNCLGI